MATTRSKDEKAYNLFTEEEIIQIVKDFEGGKSYREIAAEHARSMGSITQVIYNYRHKNPRHLAGKVALKVGDVVVAEVPKSNVESIEHTVEEAMKSVEFVSSKTEPEKISGKSQTMTPREMIKALYDQGYRIENNQLVCYVHTPVNVRDIVNG